jgi:hypothetical protein
MKQRVCRSICLAIALLSLFSIGNVFADEKPINLESKIVQDFDDPDAQPWFVMGSKFSAAEYPKLAYANAWPVSIYGNNPQNKDTLRSLGIAMLFDRKEYNWVDVVPGKKTGSGTDAKYEPTEIPLPGRVSMLDMWIWSGNFNYYIEAYIRDYKGIVHMIPMGTLNHVGWKNFRINIPTSIPQAKKYLPKLEGLTLVKFRIWTRPTEVVAIPSRADAAQPPQAIYFYFDQLKVLTDTYEEPYDGDELTRPEVIEKTWGSSDGSSGK